MTQDEQRLVERVKLGVMAENFVSSRLGEYLLDRASQEEADALQQLAIIAPSDSEGIRDLQAVVQRSRAFNQWLIDAINGMHQAEQEAAEQMTPDSTGY